MVKKLVFAPMTRDLCAAARSGCLLEGYSLSYAFVPKYLCLDGAELSRLDGGSVSPLSLTDFDKKKLAECDAVVLDYDEHMSDVGFANDVIAAAKDMGKEMLLSRALRQKLQTDGAPQKPGDSNFVENPQEDRLYEIPVPVITVVSHGVLTDQLAVELALRKHFAETGYRVGQLGSHAVCGLFGIAEMPDFVFEARDAYEKTVLFNRYALDYVNREQVELLIVGVPGAAVKFNDRRLNGLGYTPMSVCNGVRGDVSVICTHYEDYTELYFDEVSRFGRYRLNCPIRYFGLANTSIYVDPSIQDDTVHLKYVTLQSGYVLDGIREKNFDGYFLFNPLDDESVKGFCVSVQETLSGNVRYLR